MNEGIAPCAVRPCCLLAALQPRSHCCLPPRPHTQARPGTRSALLSSPGAPSTLPATPSSLPPPPARYTSRGASVVLTAPNRPLDQRAVPIDVETRFADGRSVRSVTLIVDQNPTP